MRAAPWPSADSDLFDLLAQAYLDCRRTKRNSASAQAFEQRLESSLFALHQDLASGAYRPGRSVCFVVQRPRPREVWAAQFRDRIVHWLLYNHIAPRFHAAFVADSCACIPRRGTLYAARRLEHQLRSVTHNGSALAFYLKADLANFFVSIHKPTLLARLQRRITEPWWLQLAETILMHDPRQDVEVRGYRQQVMNLQRVLADASAPQDLARTREILAAMLGTVVIGRDPATGENYAELEEPAERLLVSAVGESLGMVAGARNSSRRRFTLGG